MKREFGCWLCRLYCWRSSSFSPCWCCRRSSGGWDHSDGRADAKSLRLKRKEKKAKIPACLVYFWWCDVDGGRNNWKCLPSQKCIARTEEKFHLAWSIQSDVYPLGFLSVARSPVSCVAHQPAVTRRYRPTHQRSQWDTSTADRSVHHHVGWRRIYEKCRNKSRNQQKKNRERKEKEKEAGFGRGGMVCAWLYSFSSIDCKGSCHRVNRRHAHSSVHHPVPFALVVLYGVVRRVARNSGKGDQRLQRLFNDPRLSGRCYFSLFPFFLFFKSQTYYWIGVKKIVLERDQLHESDWFEEREINSKWSSSMNGFQLIDANLSSVRARIRWLLMFIRPDWIASQYRHESFVIQFSSWTAGKRWRRLLLLLESISWLWHSRFESVCLRYLPSFYRRLSQRCNQPNVDRTS